MSEYGQTDSSRAKTRALRVSAHLYQRGVRSRDFATMHPQERQQHAVQAGMQRDLSDQEWDLVHRGLQISEENDALYKPQDQGGQGMDPFEGLS